MKVLSTLIDEYYNTWGICCMGLYTYLLINLHRNLFTALHTYEYPRHEYSNHNDASCLTDPMIIDGIEYSPFFLLNSCRESGRSLLHLCADAYSRDVLFLPETWVWVRLKLAEKNNSILLQ